MDFSITSKSPETITSYLIVGVLADRKLTNAAKIIDKFSKGTLQRNLKSLNFSGESGKSIEITNLPGVNAKAVLVIGLGNNNCKVEFIHSIQNMFKRMRESKESSINLYLPELKAPGVNRAWMWRQISSIGTNADYQYQLRKNVLDGKSLSGATRRVSAQIEGKVTDLDRAHFKQGHALSLIHI